jgi:hypothetical protein
MRPRSIQGLPGLEDPAPFERIGGDGAPGSESGR